MGLLLNPYVIMIALAILGKCGYDYRLRKQGEERALQKVEVEYKKTKKTQKKKAIKNKIKTTEMYLTKRNLDEQNHQG